MADFKVGFSQINNATPAFIGKLRKLMLYCMAGIGAFMPLLVKWTGSDPETLIQTLGFITFGLTGLCEFFGVPIDTKNVPADQVTEIKTP